MAKQSEYIEKFIKFYANDTIIQRGKKLYEKNAVLDYTYDKNNDTYFFKIKGTKIYNTKIINLQSRNLSTSCTCPFDYGVICKHTIATLLFLKNNKSIKSNNNVKPKPIKTTRRLQNENILIENFENITIELIKEYSQNKLFNDVKSYYKLEIMSAVIKDNSLTFILGDYYSQFYKSKSVKVTFTKVKNKLQVATTDTTQSEKGKLKKAEIFCLLNIIETNTNNIFDILFNKLDEIKVKNTNLFGLEAKDFDDYFEIAYLPNTGLNLQKKPKAYGLLPIGNKINEYQEVFKALEKPKKPIILQAKSKNNQKCIAFSIFIDDDGNSNYQVFSAKPNKANTKLISGFHPYYKGSLDDSYVKEHQQKIITKIEDFEREEDDYEYIFNVSKSIFNNLAKEPFVFLNDDYDIRKRNLKQIILSNTPAKVIIYITTSKNFLEAILKYKINNSYVNLEEIDDEKSSEFMIFYKNKMHHLNSLKEVIALVNLNSGLKIVKEQQETFFNNVIKPLSKDFEIIFDDKTYKHQKIQLDYKVEQVFLSEKEDYIIIQPQVVYDNDTSVLLVNDGNYLFKDPTNNLITEYERNTELENDFLEQLAALHPNFEEQKAEKYFYLSYDDFTKDFWFYRFFDKLNTLNIEIFGLKDLKNFKYSPYKGSVSTSIKSNEDWFDVTIDVAFGNNQVSLSDIRKAIISKEKYIQLKDGSVGILPEEWLHKLEKYFRNGEIKGDSLAISKLKYSIIDELFDNIDETEIIEEIALKRKKIASFKEIKKTKVPKEIKATLRNYQKEGLNWLNFLDDMGWGGILADDMGLGKTLQILTFIQYIIKKDKTTNLIVLPTSLLFNWKAEVEKFAPKLNTHFHYGIDRTKNTKNFKKHHIVFTTYGTLLRDIEFLTKYKFNYVILDESQAIKNPSSRRYKAANLIKANNRIALTGTPIENSTFDLYAQMNFVNPGMFGSMNTFKINYSNPIDKEGNEIIASELQKIINPFLLRRTKEKVATELPPKTEDILYCEMETEQRKIYDAYRNSYRNKLLKTVEKKGLGKSKLMVLEALTRLRQICDSPSLINDVSYNNTAIKIQELLNHITQKTTNHKILIFSQFVGMLSLIKNELDKLNISYEYLDGKSNSKKRENSVNNFQNNNDLRVFLISLKAGGTGLNLTAADYVYIVDPWWNPAVENQAIDRCYRIGQAKKVFAYRMICKNTIEEKIINLQAKKKKLASDIIQTDENIMKNLTVNDINELFG